MTSTSLIEDVIFMLAARRKKKGRIPFSIHLSVCRCDPLVARRKTEEESSKGVQKV